MKLLHESLGHIITVELKTGQLYRGKLAEGTLCFANRAIKGLTAVIIHLSFPFTQPGPILQSDLNHLESTLIENTLASLFINLG